MTKIRPATINDVRAIARIYSLAYPGFEFQAHSRSGWATLTRMSDLLVAECYGEVIGFAAIKLRGYGGRTCRVAYIEGVFARPEEKDITVRPGLLRACQEAARRAGYPSVMVLSEQAEVEFFRGAGFEILGAEYGQQKCCYLAKKIGNC